MSTLYTLATGFGVFMLGYFFVIAGSYLTIHLASLLRMREEMASASWEPVYDVLTDPMVPDIAVIVPAYNEETVIADSVRSFLNISYPAFEIIIVNDGSTDDTFDILDDEFDLQQIDAPVPVPNDSSKPIHGVYQSLDNDRIRVIDKVNGGKGDAQNSGIWLTDAELFCIVDADTIIQPDCLSKMVRPFLEHPDEMVAVGGPIRVANGSLVEDGMVTQPGLPSSPIAALQQIEYIRAFFAGRLGLDRLQSLILISGAFGLFRTDVVRDAGGYDTDSLVEDIEFTIRLHRHLLDRDRSYRFGYFRNPVVWTQVPEDLQTLANQRQRWFRGLLETMLKHRDAIFRRRYGLVGMFALPFFLFGEGIGRLFEALGYVSVPIALMFGFIEVGGTLVILSGIIAFGVFLTWLSLLVEVLVSRQYTHPLQIAVLMTLGVIEFLGYRQWRTIIVVKGLLAYVRGESSWGKMERVSLGGSQRSK